MGDMGIENLSASERPVSLWREGNGEMVANFNITWRILFINESIGLISDGSFQENIKLQILINLIV
jgi:hypothetical protein